MKKISILGIFIALMLSGCSTTNQQIISTGGSTSVQPLFKEMMDDYMSENLDTHITYDGQGSSAGITGVINDKYALGTSSRNLTDEEKKENLSSDVLCLDGIVVVVNLENPVDNLSIDDLHKIYTGEITNWKELGGNDSKISVVARDSNAGTREAFEEKVGIKGKMTTNALELSSNGEVLGTIATNKDAIGYASLGEITNKVKLLSIDNVKPSVKTITSGDYEIIRPFLIVYKKEKLTADTKKFLKWIDAKKNLYAEEDGYIPLNGSINEK